eukprot:TRINITY_DN19306_c0_g1_i3.p1 TRINITY_DN19306_c0_g1~~TRINITY_DN19306_c0_g1_i3.p1  ORF type:complete len:176 (+),score=3.16 TRINITY_DN19306_c0_g1_i3:274-801(+)
MSPPADDARRLCHVPPMLEHERLCMVVQAGHESSARSALPSNVANGWCELSRCHELWISKRRNDTYCLMIGGNGHAPRQQTSAVDVRVYRTFCRPAAAFVRCSTWYNYFLNTLDHSLAAEGTSVDTLQSQFRDLLGFVRGLSNQERADIQRDNKDWDSERRRDLQDRCRQRGLLP